MKIFLFPKLALSGISKNKKMYFPYILSCIGMVMMFYIVHSLSYSPLLNEIRGGSSIEVILGLGKFVIAFFALLFLFYTNSFLVKQRYKEFGLYNILGMDKNKICVIVFWENVFIYVISLLLGVGSGILFSKFAELGLLNAIKKGVDYRFTVSGEAIYYTLGLFSAIFIVLLFRSVLQVRHSDPIQLLKSKNKGEKPPKGNFFFSLAGIIILMIAYYLAATIKSPLTALTVFFVAVIMVIVATYLLFISGSVTFCGILKRNKNYYYDKKHYISVSTMSFRMKRNGAGLASICILCTMVLVMVTSTTSLYFGSESCIKARFPQESYFSLNFENLKELNDENIALAEKEYRKVLDKNGIVLKKEVSYKSAQITGMLNGTNINVNIADSNYFSKFDEVRTLFFITAEDYSEYTGEDIDLSNNEVIIHPVRCNYNEKQLTVENIKFGIKSVSKKKIEIGDLNVMITPSIVVVVKDFSVIDPLDELRDGMGNKMLEKNYYLGYDIKGNDRLCLKTYEEVENLLTNADFSFVNHLQCSCLPKEKDDFYISIGGLFFLGIILSAIFIFAAVMIIYYKQISEGYEDRSRFDIMQKIGMTKEDIKKSIDSQVVTVFFAPLILSGIHLCFAFPLIWKSLQLFNLHQLRPVIIITVISYACFAAVYTVIYKLTARAYYNIVCAGQ